MPEDEGSIAELVEVNVKLAKWMLNEIDKAVERSFLGFKGRDDFIRLAIRYYLETISFSMARSP